MTALRRNGFSNLSTSQSIDDGLRLSDAFIAAVVRCAPPANKPTPEELVACHPHLEAELAQLRHVRVVVALGKIAFDAWWKILAGRGVAMKPRPAFGHGVVYRVPGHPHVVGSYHPSRQNTHTGKLTPKMLDAVFRKAAKLARADGPEPRG
jgi:uracil-DNA glycosylase family 4